MAADTNAQTGDDASAVVGLPSALARFAALTPYPLLLADAAGAIRFANRRWQDATGLDDAASAGDGWLNAVHPDDRPALAVAWRRAVEQHGELEQEARLLHGDTARWHLLRASAPSPDEDDSYRVLVALDIDRRRRAEEGLRASEERLRLALTSAPIVIFRQDLDLRYTWVYNSLSERPPGTLLGSTEYDLMPAEQADAFVQFKRAVIDSGRALRAELHATTAVGDNSFDMFVEPVRDAAGAVVGVTGVALDITARKQAEREREALLQAERAALAEAEAAQQRLILLAGASRAFPAQALDVANLVDTVARYTAEVVGDACLVRLISADGQDLEATGLHHTDPEALKLGRRYLELPMEVDRSLEGRVYRSGEPLFMRQIDFERMPQRFRAAFHAFLERFTPVSAVIVPLRAGARILGTLAVTRYLPSAPYTDADLLLVQELADRAALNIRNAQLYVSERSALAEARAALTERDAFLATVSHDLKTPLTTISGMVQLTQRQLVRLALPETEGLAERLRRIDAATSKMTRMVAELVDLSRLASGHVVDLDLAPHDLVALVRRAVQEAQAAYPERTITLASDEEAFDGAWDAARIDRVVSNLLSNAVKYSGERTPIAVTLTREQGLRGDEAVLRVRDEGYGIPANDLPRIFERFYRAANVQRRASGAGIGLAGVKHAVEQHGGTIAVESAEGIGSTFTVRLPLGD